MPNFQKKKLLLPKVAAILIFKIFCPKYENTKLLVSLTVRDRAISSQFLPLLLNGEFHTLIMGQDCVVQWYSGGPANQSLLVQSLSLPLFHTPG